MDFIRTLATTYYIVLKNTLFIHICILMYTIFEILKYFIVKIHNHGIGFPNNFRRELPIVETISMSKF